MTDLARPRSFRSHRRRHSNMGISLRTALIDIFYFKPAICKLHSIFLLESSQLRDHRSPCGPALCSPLTTGTVMPFLIFFTLGLEQHLVGFYWPTRTVRTLHARMHAFGRTIVMINQRDHLEDFALFRIPHYNNNMISGWCITYSTNRSELNRTSSNLVKLLSWIYYCAHNRSTLIHCLFRIHLTGIPGISRLKIVPNFLRYSWLGPILYKTLTHPFLDLIPLIFYVLFRIVMMH